MTQISQSSALNQSGGTLQTTKPEDAGLSSFRASRPIGVSARNQARLGLGTLTWRNVRLSIVAVGYASSPVGLPRTCAVIAMRSIHPMATYEAKTDREPPDIRKSPHGH